MIIGSQNLSDMFSVFHDGGIVLTTVKGVNLEFEIEIGYLAGRIKSEYQIFRLTLFNVRNLSFKTWPKSSEALPDLFSSASQIFEPELEVLSCEIEGDFLKVICNQASEIYSYCGGELLLQADSAVVTDEGGKSYSIVELRQLCKDYWDEFSAKKSDLKSE